MEGKVDLFPFIRPKTRNGVTKEVITGCGSLLVTINFDDFGYPFEVRCKLGKSGGCPSSQTEAIGNMSSLILLNTLPKERLHMMKKIIKQLKGITCSHPCPSSLSCSDGVALALENYMEAKEGGDNNGKA